MTASAVDRITAALDAADACWARANEVRGLLEDFPEPDDEVIRRRLTTVMADLENARHTALKVIRDIVAILGGT